MTNETTRVSETRFTPGPWEWKRLRPDDIDFPGTMIHGASGVGVAAIFFHVGQDDEADARLIAAAPRLLASLQTIVHGLREGWWGQGSGELEEGELQLAEAAIAKALGESS